jgi:hypothetical protein
MTPRGSIPGVNGTLAGKGRRVRCGEPGHGARAGRATALHQAELPLPEQLRPSLGSARARRGGGSGRSAEYRAIGPSVRASQHVVDLVAALDRGSMQAGEYHGLAW